MVRACFGPFMAPPYRQPPRTMTQSARLNAFDAADPGQQLDS